VDLLATALRIRPPSRYALQAALTDNDVERTFLSERLDEVLRHP